MDSQRLLPWFALGLLLWVNYESWQRDYARPAPSSPSSATAPAASGSLADQVPGAPPLPAAAPAAGTVAATSGAQAAPPAAQTHAPALHVTTDVLDLDISTQGGTLERADLLDYPVTKKDPGKKVRLLADQPPEARFLLESGLVGVDGASAPDHRAEWHAQAEQYHLAPGQAELLVPLTWSDGHGLGVTKTFVFKPGSYAIELRYSVRNDGPQPWRGASYAQLLRHYEEVDRSMWNPDTYAYRGPAIYTGEKYQKLDVKKPDADALPKRPVAGGWAAALQHHFVAAIVPGASVTASYSLSYAGGDYLLREVDEARDVASGASAEFHSTFFVGPKLQAQLVQVSPELDRTADYGRLTIIAKPLFWLLAAVHRFIGNWGFTIIFVTFLIKLAFYKLAATSGRSMAKMRNLAPRMKDIQERYKDNREELGKQMMELYKREKINPLAGCLPIVVQIPVFIAFYWVLLESVEMRQAPWLLWVQDLSSRDPYFILPVVMAGAMWLQFKLNPPPPDPMQAKIFAFMPFVMAFTMAFFPAGLVLYWITNTALSVLQQWRINKVVEAESKRPRA
jgi:YidC/Oxa1 family membrane protein insertase